MIWIRYNEKLGELVAEGHSSAAPVGQDIVCAAVSTTMDMIAVMLPWHKTELLQETGYQVIRCQGARARQVFGRGVSYLAAIASQYPDQIRVLRK